MGYRGGQFDVAHALSSYRAFAQLHPTHLTAQAGSACSLVFAAGTAPGDHWSEDLFAEQPLAFGLKREIVERQRRSHLPITPCADGFGGGKLKANAGGSMWDHHRCIPPAGQRDWSSDGQREQGACACPGVQRTCYDVSSAHLGREGSGKCLNDPEAGQTSHNSERGIGGSFG